MMEVITFGYSVLGSGESARAEDALARYASGRVRGLEKIRRGTGTVFLKAYKSNEEAASVPHGRKIGILTEGMVMALYVHGLDGEFFEPPHVVARNLADIGEEYQSMLPGTLARGEDCTALEKASEEAYRSVIPLIETAGALCGIAAADEPALNYYTTLLTEEKARTYKNLARHITCKSIRKLSRLGIAADDLEGIQALFEKGVLDLGESEAQLAYFRESLKIYTSLVNHATFLNAEYAAATLANMGSALMLRNERDSYEAAEMALSRAAGLSPENGRIRERLRLARHQLEKGDFNFPDTLLEGGQYIQ
ncbi:MAG: hypothetical protein HY518_03215 [Candidatus Aenigmarchaeota archaeon]|nr:hypothetical protein [Candidatus Aenigmarchaeota archaeon]